MKTAIFITVWYLELTINKEMNAIEWKALKKKKERNSKYKWEVKKQ